MKTSDNIYNFFHIVQKLVEFNRISHAYVIEIDDYDRDFQYILDFVKIILCQKENKTIDIHNCGDCHLCSLIDSNNYLDLKIIEPDGSFIKKKQLLDLQVDYSNKSLLDNKRIYIIKEAEKLNTASANTILKFLEEPEDNIIAILVTNNRYRLLETILSRCQVLSLKNSINVVSDLETIIFFLKALIKKDDLFVKYTEMVNSFLSDKILAKQFFSDLEIILINFLCYSVDSVDFSCGEEICFVLKNVDFTDIVGYISIIEEEINKLEYNVNYKLWMDSLFARLIGGCRYG